MDNRQPTPQRSWFWAKEAAEVLGVSVNTLMKYTKLRKNKPPLYRIIPKGRVRFPRDEFIKWSQGGPTP